MLILMRILILIYIKLYKDRYIKKKTKMKELNKTTLAEQIYHILRHDIITRQVKPGQSLTLKSLQERFGVSSTPIREALTRISEDGLAEYSTNIGINVIRLTDKDLEDIFTFAADLDSLAVSYCFNGPERDATSADLEENIRCLEKATRDGDMDAWKHYSDSFHMIFYNHCNNSRLITASYKVFAQMEFCSAIYEKDPKIQASIYREHKEIFREFRDGECRDAQDLIREHVRNGLRYARETMQNEEE